MSGLCACMWERNTAGAAILVISLAVKLGKQLV
jgi:hypothetical protein